MYNASIYIIKCKLCINISIHIIMLLHKTISMNITICEIEGNVTFDFSYLLQGKNLENAFKFSIRKRIFTRFEIFS